MKEDEDENATQGSEEKVDEKMDSSPSPVPLHEPKKRSPSPVTGKYEEEEEEEGLTEVEKQARIVRASDFISLCSEPSVTSIVLQ